MSAAEMFYIPNCKTSSRTLRTRLRSGCRQSPSAMLQHAGKRIFDCVVQSLATISLAYGHYPAVAVPPDQASYYCPHHPPRRRQTNTNSATVTCAPRPSTSCSVHSVPDRVASDHNAREKRKAEMQPREKKRRPMSAIIFSSRSGKLDSNSRGLTGKKCKYSYMNEESVDSLAELPFLREVQAREFL
ncbi:hypothetical protein ABW21_db0201823 [Orbilia brochopaga]|nr:hypothetical protein ABW21_db0201823 [Drechslerella brochopaga]